MATKPKPTGLEWLTPTDSARVFELTNRELRCLRESKQVKTRTRAAKSYHYCRADLETATGKRPKITKLCAAGARLYCAEKWGVGVSAQWIERNREAGRIGREPFGKADHLHDTADLDKLCDAPEVDANGIYSDDNGTWVVAPTAERRCKSNQQTLAKYSADGATHPLLDRGLKGQDRIVRLQHANGHWFRKRVRAYAVADVEQIERIVGAANQAKADLAVRDAASTDDDWPTHWPTAPELKKRWGWNNLSRDRKRFPLLDGRELTSREQNRRIARGIRPMRVFDPALCKEARRKQLSGDPVGKVRVVDVANELGMHRAIVHAWNGKQHAAIGGKLVYTEHRARRSDGSTRKLPFMSARDRDKLLAYYKPTEEKAVPPTPPEAQVYPFADLADRFDLPLHWFYEGCREPGRGLDHRIEPVAKLASVKDTNKTRDGKTTRWKHRRRRVVKHAPLADAIAMARWAAAQDGKPHGLNGQSPSGAIEHAGQVSTAGQIGIATADPKPKRGRGRPKGRTKYDAAQDARLGKRWGEAKSQGKSQVHFAHENGLTHRQFQRLLSRLRFARATPKGA